MTQQVSGNLHVSNDVLADLAGNAALGCYGIVGMASPTASDGFANILPANRLRRGIVVTGNHVDMYVIVEYGTNINAVSQNLIDNVTYELTEHAQVPVEGVAVHVQGIKVRK